MVGQPTLTGGFRAHTPGEGAESIGDTKAHVNFNAPAVLRKWPSLRNERRTDGASPYLLVDGTP
jgi:hypothetical protein